MRSFNIGIDLGLQGCVCIQNCTGIHTYPMPVEGKHINWDELYKLLEPFEGGNGILVFEKLGQIFKSSKATAMSMGRQSEGMIVMCKCLSIPYCEVYPKDWQGKLFAGIDKIYRADKLDTKMMSIIKCKQLYPQLKLTFGERAVKPNSNITDSILLMEYARRYL